MKLYNVFKLLYTQTHNAHCFVEGPSHLQAAE